MIYIMKTAWMDFIGNAYLVPGNLKLRRRKMPRTTLPKPPVLLTISRQQITPLDFDLIVKDLEMLENWCVDLYEYLDQKEGDHP